MSKIISKIINVALVITVVCVVMGWLTQPYWSAKTQDVYVKNTERVEEVYLVYSDKGVFRNQDSWHYLKFDSSDLYNTLEHGKTYSCKSFGFRVGFFSMYPNLVSCVVK